MSITRPVLRYHGSKFRLAPWLISLMPKHACYVEAYGGGAGVLLRKPPVGVECYNDLDEQVVTVFRVLRDVSAACELQRRIELTPYARAEFNWSYEPPTDLIDGAHKTIVRSFMGHGSDSATRGCRTGFRAKPTEHRSTPAKEWATWQESIASFVDRLRGVVIENRAALEIVGRFDNAETLFYMDPPYVGSTRSSLVGRSARTHGYRFEMTDDDHEELAERLGQVKGMVMVSGYPSSLYRRLYSGWQRVERRSVADGGKPRTEVVWFNDRAASLVPQGQLFQHAVGS